jgi:ABC-type sugar transport system ATPase subunit
VEHTAGQPLVSDVLLPPPVEDTPFALELRGITKAFGAIEALRGVDLQLRRGELLGLVGDNGAGKSTLVKVLSGAVIPDSGEIWVNGATVSIQGPEDAHRLGVEMIYQDLALFNNLDASANVFIGRERRTMRWFMDRSRMEREAADVLQRMNVNIPSTRVVVENMSGGQRQMIACARAVAFDSRILVMDEPTAALGVREANALLDLVKSLKGAHSIILITQRIPDVLALADRVMVLKGGLSQGVLNVDDVTLDDIVTLIVKGRTGAPASSANLPGDVAPA